MKYILFLLLSFISVVGFSQQADIVDFKDLHAEISFNTETSTVIGKAHVDFTILKPTDSIYIDAKHMEILGVSNRNSVVDYQYNGKQIIYKSNFKIGETYVLNINYKTKPKKALYFVNWNEPRNHPEYNPQIWTQGQGKYTSNWLPSIDDMNDKITFFLSIDFDNNFEVIANGNLDKKIIGETKTIWHYAMEKPMSSYLVALSIGKYSKTKEYSKSGIPLEFYYYPKDSLKVESTYKYSKQMFDFLETEIGVAYPWQNYKQVPVKDFLYSGMENTSCTIFSDAFMVDNIAFNDNNYVNVNAHELAHQWFGDLVTETSGTHHWLQEGFATYYALLAEKEVFGEDYYYEQLYNYAQELLNQDKQGNSTALLNPKSSSVTFYKKGAWVLHLLREKTGNKAFKKSVKRYLNLYKYKNVATKNFIDEVEKASGQDLSKFVKKWLEDKTLHFNLIETSLEKSSFYQELQMVDCEVKNSKCKDWLKAPISNAAKTKIINQQPGLISSKLFKSPLKVRQAIAFSLQTIPLNLKTEFETLLEDSSYLTIEAALYKLWVNFPEDKARYLNKTKLLYGNNNKNIRMLWLALALNTDNYFDSTKELFFNELVEYTKPVYSFNVRQTAFNYLKELNAFNTLAIQNLKQATTHYNWRFSSFAKTLFKQVKRNK